MFVRGYRVSYLMNDGYKKVTLYDDYHFLWGAKLAIWLLQRQKGVSDIQVRAFVKQY